MEVLYKEAPILDYTINDPHVSIFLGQGDRAPSHQRAFFRRNIIASPKAVISYSINRVDDLDR
jgi:hypothetical protein